MSGEQEPGMYTRRLRQVTLVGVFFLLTAVVILLLVPSPNQYELSIYDAYPVSFWAAVVGAMLVGSVVMVGSARVSGDQSWLYGLFLVLVTNAMLLFMPYVRGYQMYGRADPLTHIGYIKDIGNTGGIGANIYPPTHLLVVALTDATGADPMFLGMFVPIFFSAIYFGAMFYLLAYLFDSRERILFGLPFAVLPVLRDAHLGFRPFDLSLMLVPLVLYLFVKSNRYPTPAVRLTLVATLISLLLYHPLTALFIISVFAVYLGARYAPKITEQYATPTNIFSLSAAVFVAWYTTFAGIILRFETVKNVLFGLSEGESPVESYAETAQEASPALIDIVRVVTFKYGLEVLLFGLGFTFLCLAFWLVYTEERYIDSYTILFAGTLGLFGVGGSLFLLLDLIVRPERPFQIAKIGAVVLTGQLFYFLSTQFDWSGKRTDLSAGFYASFMVVILLVAALSTGTVYRSPFSSEKNQQVTQMEIEGAEWLTEHRDRGTDKLLTFGMNYNRHYDALYGTIPDQPYWGTLPAPHFNYTERETLGQSYTDRYMTITRQGRILYPQAFGDYRKKWRYTPEEFARLEHDPTNNRIYDNGDYNQYLIQGEQYNEGAG